MAASKTLILLKGIGGIAATSLATLGGMEIGYKLQSTKTVGTAHSGDSSWDIEEIPEDYIEEVSDLGIPSGCVETCDLTSEQLRGLKFGRRSNSSILFDGLTESDTFELTISGVSEDTANYPHGKKYTLKTKATASETITIKNVKGDDIVLGKEEGVDLRETDEGGWLEKVPEEINDLGIPKRCEDEQAEDSTTKTCELTADQLQRLKFEPKEDETSIRVSGLKDKNTVTLTVEDSTDKDNYPKGKKYTLKSTTGTVTIKGTKERDIVLEANKGVDFREKQGDSKLLETVEDSLGIPRRCDEKCELTKEELQRLKFQPKDDNTSIEVDGLDNDNDKVELTIEDKEDDRDNYPKGKKYILKASNGEATIKGVKGGDIVLEEDDGEVVIRETSSGGKLEKAPEEVNELGIPKGCTTDSESSCQLTKDQLQRFKFEAKGNEEITVDGLAEGSTVTLEIVDKSSDLNYPKGKKYTLTSAKDNVTIRNVKEGDIVLGAGGSVEIRETGRGGKLEKVPEEVDKLGIPTSCSRSCKLTLKQLQKLKFETRSSSSISIEGLEENNTVDLKVEEITGDKTNYPHGKKYTLKSTNSKVTIKGLKEGDIEIEAKGVVIREKQSGRKLERGPEEVDNLGIPKNCINKCELTKEQLKKLKFEPGSKSSVWISGMGVNDKVELTIAEVSGDADNYPKSKKYSFRAGKDGVEIKGTKDGNIDLEKDKEVLIREKSSRGKLETVEDSLGIPKSCKANQVKNNQPQTCQLTSDQLKHLKLKTFGGKNAHASVSGLTNKIKLTMSWVEDGNNYPGNIKYSFNNTDNERDIRISRSGQEVTIEKKRESWFKNNGGLLELVEANTKSQVKTKEANEILEKLGLGLEKLKLTTGDFNNIYSPQHKKKEVDFSRDGDLKKIQFKVFNGGAEQVIGLSGQKITVYFEWDSSNKYPKNMKFTFENNRVSQSIDLTKNGKSVQIWKKSSSKPYNPDNIKNRFKVENDLLVNVPQGS